MSDNRKHERHKCKISAEFKYWEGAPGEVDIESDPGEAGTGWIVDWSKSGLLLITDKSMSINIPIKMKFRNEGKYFALDGHIVRIGLAKDNPSVMDQLTDDEEIKGKFFVGINFNELIDDLKL